MATKTRCKWTNASSGTGAHSLSWIKSR